MYSENVFSSGQYKLKVGCHFILYYKIKRLSNVEKVLLKSGNEFFTYKIIVFNKFLIYVWVSTILFTQSYTFLHYCFL